MLFGDVFLCGGQSNMQMTTAMAMNGAKEVEDSINYPLLRVFTVAQKSSLVPLLDVVSQAPYQVSKKGWTLLPAIVIRTCICSCAVGREFAGSYRVWTPFSALLSYECVTDSMVVLLCLWFVFSGPDWQYFSATCE